MNEPSIVKLKNMVYKVNQIIVVFVFFVLLESCGIYSFKGKGIGGINLIAVEPFESRVAEFGVAERITEELVNRLLKERIITLSSPVRAEGILKGTLISLTDRPLTFLSNEQVTEYEVVIEVEAKLIPTGKSEPIWAEKLIARGSYPYREGSLSERQEGIDKAIERLVQDIINQLISDW